MTSDPLRELVELVDESQIDADQPLPRINLSPQVGSGETDEKVWPTECRRAATQLWQIVLQWFDSWFRTVLIGVVIGAIFGFIYPWIVLSE
jgi:hypothetical protein